MGHRFTRLALAVALVTMSGCGGGVGPTVEVVGTVTYEGEPAEDAEVTFFPEQGRPARGVTDVSGKFVLSTFESGDGAVPGKHVITITEYYEEPPPFPGTSEDGAPKPLDSRFPEKYGDPETTPLEREVEPGGVNQFDLKI